MNRKMRIEFLIGNGYFAVRVGNNVYGIAPKESNLKPVYIPVKANTGKKF